MPPPAPTVTASALGISSITWVWSQSPTATGYRVLSSTGGGNISGNLPTTTTSFILAALAKNTSAAVTIEAFNADGNGDAALSAAYTLAAAPTGTAILGSSFGQVMLAWSANGNTSTTTYSVSWYTDGTSTVTFSTQSVNATITNITGNTTAFFSVAAVNGDGLRTPYDITRSTFIGVQPSQPAFTTSTIALGVSSITWSWTASSGAASYQLFNTTNVPVSPLLSSAVSSFTQTGLSTNTAYSLYVQAIGSSGTINSSPLTRYTLANPTTGLALLGLTIGPNGISERVSWGPNSNPAGTNYVVQWWTVATATVTVSSAATIATVSNIFAGSTVYFTVQAQNGDGINANFDATLFTLAPSTFVASASQAINPGGTVISNFVLPSGLMTVVVSSLTFSVPVTLSVQTPALNAVPAAGAGLAALPSPVNLQITANDAVGNALQPARPISIVVSYGNAGSLDPGRLVLARYDAIRAVWIALATGRDPLRNQVSAFTDHLSLFAVLTASPAGDLSSITIGPNPLRPMVNPGQVATFRNLPAQAHVRIYTYVGEAVADLTADAAGLASWGGKNKADRWVASGVYLVLIESGGARVVKHLAVER